MAEKQTSTIPEKQSPPIDPKVKRELLDEYGHRQVNALVRSDGPVAQFIFDHFPGTYTGREWRGVLRHLDGVTEKLEDWV